MDEELKIKVEDMHMGRLIGILSHQMARNRNNPSIVMESDELTAMQKHVLKFILLETLHRDLYQKDIEEEFQIRKSTATGILQLMEKKGFIYRECAKQDGRLKRIVPTDKAKDILLAILEHIDETERCLEKRNFKGRCSFVQTGAVDDAQESGRTAAKTKQVILKNAKWLKKHKLFCIFAGSQTAEQLYKIYN